MQQRWQSLQSISNAVWAADCGTIYFPAMCKKKKEEERKVQSWKYSVNFDTNWEKQIILTEIYYTTEQFTL